MNRRNFLLTAFFIGGSSLSFVTPVSAQRRLRWSRGMRGGTKQYTQNTLTQAQIKECLLVEKRIDEKQIEIDELEKKINIDRSEIEYISNGIDYYRGKIDLSDRYQVNEYNKAIDCYDIRIKELEYRINIFNSYVIESEKDIASFNSICAGKRYYEEDLALVKREIGL